MRALNTFYTNNSKRFYSLMLDHTMTQVRGDVKKKEIFFFIQNEEVLYNAFLVQALIFTAIMSSIVQIDNHIAETLSDYQKQQNEVNEDLPPKEKMVLQKKLDFQTKNVKDEFLEISNRTRTFFSNKIEKNMKRVTGFGVKMNADDFKKLQGFLAGVVQSLKINFKVNSLNLVSVLEDQQKKYFVALKELKTEELKMLLDDELWVQAPVVPFFQSMVDKICSIDLFDQVLQHEETKEVSEWLCTPDSDRYKVSAAFLKFLHMVFDFLKLIRSFPSTAFEGSARLVELLKFYNQYTCSLILGSGVIES